MLIYNQNSRYYNVDDENEISQLNFTKYKFDYDTTVVLDNEQHRLDLVSYRVYDTPVNWHIIARFNAIIEPNYVPAGTILKIPRLQ